MRKGGEEGGEESEGTIEEAASGVDALTFLLMEAFVEVFRIVKYSPRAGNNKKQQNEREQVQRITK